jgi:hypothetical protein
MTIVYLAGPYRGAVRANVRRAEAYAARLWACGYAVLCPHLNTAFMDDVASPQTFLDGDLEMIRALARSPADFILALLPGWRRSKGTLGERKLARSLGVEVVTADALLRRAGRG